ncbi:MAG TPA: hypothetical protein VL282_16120 [Tepidisphaeraceae bacterium]|nr:hypothetical protein [Tepidisphaeraceae bacterium]
MDTFEFIRDPLIREGVEQAVQKTLMAALVQRVYPGHFTVTADGSHFGSDITWPGLDSWEMAGAYLLLGRPEVAQNYFAFTRVSQKPDGNIPFAIVPAEPEPARDTYFRGMHYPEDIYEHTSADGSTRRWVGLFDHWQINANPLSVLAPICYVLTANEIVGAKPPINWLAENIKSIDLAGRHVLSRKSENGLISGAGFYIECPPRNQWDGITQCYAIEAFRNLAELCASLGQGGRAHEWTKHADALTQAFQKHFWRVDHFAEYVHPEKGVVDRRKLSDVNFAAIGLNVATDAQAKVLWPKLLADESFWFGGMPTQLVSQPQIYEPWEWPEPLPWEHANGPVYDVAAMGRVWYLDALASIRMGAWDRLRASVRLVCQSGKAHDWKWFERYHAKSDGQVEPKGPGGYCEYAAILVRIVLRNAEQF